MTGMYTVLGVQEAAETLVAKSKYSTREYMAPKTIKSKKTKTMSARILPGRRRCQSSERYGSASGRKTSSWGLSRRIFPASQAKPSSAVGTLSSDWPSRPHRLSFESLLVSCSALVRGTPGDTDEPHVLSVLSVLPRFMLSRRRGDPDPNDSHLIFLTWLTPLKTMA